MNTELLQVWKLILSLIHMDGKVTTEEKEWFEKKMLELQNHKLLNASEDDIIILRETFQNPVNNYLEKLTQIKKPAKKSFVLHMVRTIGHLDNDYSDDEKKVFQDIEKHILKDLDITEFEKQAEKMELDSYKFNNFYDINERDSFIKILSKIIATYL